MTQKTSDWFDERTTRKKQSVSLLWLTRRVFSADVQHRQREDLKISSLPLSSIGPENVAVFSLTLSHSFCSSTFADACRLEHTWAQTTDLLYAQENSQLILISSPSSSLAFALLMKRSELLQKNTSFFLKEYFNDDERTKRSSSQGGRSLPRLSSKS